MSGDFDDEGVGKNRRQPHYAKRTISRWAPEFAGHEQDVIRQCFSAGSYTSLRGAMPKDLAPDSVNALRRHRMNKNRLAEAEPQTWSKMTQHWGSGHHKDFEYMPDPFDHKAGFEKQLRQQSVEQRGKVANHDWRHVSQEKRMKHEAMIENPRNKETYPYLGGDKDSDNSQWSMSRRSPRDVRSHSISGQATGSFLAGKGRGLEDDSRTSRMMLPTIVQRLQKRVEADWEGTAVVVSATDQDLVQVAFHLESVDCERGVLAYMGVFSKDVELVGNLGLRKVSQLWGMSRTFAEGGQDDSFEAETTWIFFLLCPKWVRMRPTDAYYTIRPRQVGSTFRMSNAGSSVMLSLSASATDPAEQLRETTGRRDMSRSGPSAPSGYRETLEMAFAAASTPRKRGTEIDMSLIEKAITTLPAI
mmetsp:Transcript_92134/g.182976  ORF Transcript_92134/g.182976 Transcript_92134/m.182976 type:complete len:416 (+) Transcript_92134:142-1389(+)